jgi:hypothetical protein
MGPIISRDKEPGEFWRNVWAAIIMATVSVIAVVLSILFILDPNL